MSESTSDPKRTPAASDATAGAAARAADGGADVLAAYRAAQRALQADEAVAAGAPGALSRTARPHTAAEPGDAPFERDAPRAETRAAILAAAARAVQARPQPVGADGVVRVEPRRRFRDRLPLALAASLLVGALAWQLAAQFDDAAAPPVTDGAPTASAPTAPAASGAQESIAAPSAAAAAHDSAVAGSAPSAATAMTKGANKAGPAPAAAPSSASPVPQVAPTAGPTPIAAPVASAESVANAAPATAPPIAAGDGPAPAAPVDRSAGGGRPPVAAAAAPRREADAPPASPEALARLQSKVAQQVEAQRAAAAEARSDLVAPSPAPAEQQVRTQPVDRRLFAEDPAPRPLAAWLERIGELRRAGRDAEAEAELQALRRAYPQAEIPPALTRPLPR